MARWTVVVSSRFVTNGGIDLATAAGSVDVEGTAGSVNAGSGR